MLRENQLRYITQKIVLFHAVMLCVKANRSEIVKYLLKRLIIFRTSFRGGADAHMAQRRDVFICRHALFRMIRLGENTFDISTPRAFRKLEWTPKSAR